MDFSYNRITFENLFPGFFPDWSYRLAFNIIRSPFSFGHDWVFIPLSLELLLSILHPTATIFGPVRYLIFILPAYLILVSIGVSNLKKPYSNAAIIIFVLLSILPLASYYNNIDKHQWRETAIFIKKKLKSH